MSLRAWAYALPLGLILWAGIIIAGLRLRDAAARGELIVLNLGDVR